MASIKKSYQQLRKELDTILDELESKDIDIDEALALHKKGQEILNQMEKYLENISDAIKTKKS